jgi:Toxin SymE, type I toxin-antitoxin system
MAEGNSTPPERRSVPCVCFERRIKVGRGLYERRRKDSAAVVRSQPVPWIRLQGRWLEQAGFGVGAQLLVRVTRGCLVLTVEKNDE